VPERSEDIISPDLLNDDNLMEICDGEVAEKFGALDGFKELNDAVGKYFERGKP
jgi:hypothetical protein